MIRTKQCIKCQTRKPFDNFNEYEPGKKRNVCKLCQRKHNSDWEYENRKRHESGLPDYPETKVCYKCKVEKSRDDYTKDWTRKDGLYSMCKACASLKSQRIYKTYKNREDARAYDYRLKKHYGITTEQKKQMFEQQGHCCAICKSKSSGRLIKGKEAVWNIDHDHETGKVRGILCIHCNTALGIAKESIERLYAMIDYIKLHKNLIPYLEGVGWADGGAAVVAT